MAAPWTPKGIILCGDYLVRYQLCVDFGTPLGCSYCAQFAQFKYIRFEWKNVPFRRVFAQYSDGNVFKGIRGLPRGPDGADEIEKAILPNKQNLIDQAMAIPWNAIWENPFWQQIKCLHYDQRAGGYNHRFCTNAQVWKAWYEFQAQVPKYEEWMENIFKPVLQEWFYFERLRFEGPHPMALQRPVQTPRGNFMFLR